MCTTLYLISLPSGANVPNNWRAHISSLLFEKQAKIPGVESNFNFSVTHLLIQNIGSIEASLLRLLGFSMVFLGFPILRSITNASSMHHVFGALS